MSLFATLKLLLHFVTHHIYFLNHLQGIYLAAFIDAGYMYLLVITAERPPWWYQGQILDGPGTSGLMTWLSLAYFDTTLLYSGQVAALCSVTSHYWYSNFSGAFVLQRSNRSARREKESWIQTLSCSRLRAWNGMPWVLFDELNVCC